MDIRLPQLKVNRDSKLLYLKVNNNNYIHFKML